MPITRDDLPLTRGRGFRTSGELWMPDPESWYGRLGALLLWPFRRRNYTAFEGLRLATNWGRRVKRGAASRADVARWNRLMRARDGEALSPSLAESIVLRDLPTPSSLCIELGDFTVDMTIIMHDGPVPLALARSRLWPLERLAHHKAVRKLSYPTQSDTPLQGDLSIAPRLTRNLVRLYDRMGINQIELIAGWSGGSAVWPKYGFRPKRQFRWERLKSTFRRRHANMAVAECEATRDAFDDATKGPDPRLIFKVSDLSFRTYRELDRATILARYPHDLSGYLLQGLRWSGVLRLDDIVSRRRLEAYLERKGFAL